MNKSFDATRRAESSVPPLESATPWPANRGLPWWTFAVVGTIALLLWVPRLSGPIDLRYDAGVYYLLGISLAEGEGYRISSEPGNPAAVQYPPALPAFVALHAKVFRTTDPVELGRWLRRSYFLLFLGFSFCCLTLARTFLSPFWATAATCLCLLQLNTFLLSDLLFTELPFALVSVLFMRLLIVRAGDWSQPPHEFLGFVLVSLGFLLRTAGIALLATWVLDAVFYRRWRLAAVRALLALLPFALWQGYVMRVRAGADYQQPAYAYQRAPYQFYNVPYAENMALTDPFRPERGRADARVIKDRLVANLAVIPYAIGEAVSSSLGFWKWALNDTQDAVLGSRRIPEWTVRIPLLLLALTAGIGLWVIAARGYWAFPIFVLGSTGLICLTPWPGQFSRYLAPLVDFVAIAAVVGGLWIHRAGAAALPRRLQWTVSVPLVTLAAVTVAVQSFTVVQAFRRRQQDPSMAAMGRPLQHHFFYHDRSWKAWEDAVSWIAAHAPAEAVVATVSPHLCYLWTGRRSIFPPMEVNPTTARQQLEAVPVSYVIIDELEFLDTARVYAEPAMQSDSSRWELVHTVDQTRIYARKPLLTRTEP